MAENSPHIPLPREPLFTVAEIDRTIWCLDRYEAREMLASHLFPSADRAVWARYDASAFWYFLDSTAARAECIRQAQTVYKALREID